MGQLRNPFHGHNLMASGQRYKSKERVSSYHLIDRYHILIIQEDGVHAFSFNPHRTAPRSPARTKPGGYLLRLSLPPVNFDRRGHTSISHLRIPRSHPDDRPMFRPDPKHSSLAVCMYYSTFHDEQPISLASSIHLVILVSLSTIHAYLVRAVKTRPRRRSIAPPWETWAPTGARVISMENVSSYRTPSL